jgi:hypothetical protein
MSRELTGEFTRAGTETTFYKLEVPNGAVVTIVTEDAGSVGFTISHEGNVVRYTAQNDPSLYTSLGSVGAQRLALE